MSRRILAGLALGMMISGCDSSTEDPVVEPEIAATEEAVPEVVESDPDLTAWIAENYAEFSDDVLYLSGEADLDGDGTDEILAYIGGPMLCGSGGCDLVVLQRTGQGLSQVGDLSVARLPVGMFEGSTNGWRDLAVSVAGGGMSAGVAKVPFGENAYASNPTVAPAEMSEEPFETIIAQEQLQPLN